MKLYVINLQGQGDTHIKLVSQDSWDALDTGNLTDAMIEDGNTNYSEPEGWVEEFKWLSTPAGRQSGSWENDVALHLPAVSINGETAEFFSLSEYTKFIRNHPEIEIVDEYEGYIY